MNIKKTDLIAIILWGTSLSSCTYQQDKDLSFIHTQRPTLLERRETGAFKPTTADEMRAIEPDRSHAGSPLDLADYEVTFEDDFNTMSVTDAAGTGPWYSPVHGGFGASKFVAPRKGQGPVLVRDGKLIIQLYKENGRWISSNIQTVNKAGEGFAQQYGYFEMRGKFPPQYGSWGAFWLHSHPALTGPRAVQTEIDVIEAYGGDPRGHHVNIHLWPTKGKGEMRIPLEGDIVKRAGKGAYTKVDGMFEDFHTYGVLITPENMIFYFDRKELVRMPTKPEFQTPQYILLDLALLGKQAKKAKGLMEMEVDYVRVWQKKSD